MKWFRFKSFPVLYTKSWNGIKPFSTSNREYYYMIQPNYKEFSKAQDIQNQNYLQWGREWKMNRLKRKEAVELVDNTERNRKTNFPAEFRMCSPLGSLQAKIQLPPYSKQTYSLIACPCFEPMWIPNAPCCPTSLFYNFPDSSNFAAIILQTGITSFLLKSFNEGWTSTSCMSILSPISSLLTSTSIFEGMRSTGQRNFKLDLTLFR